MENDKSSISIETLKKIAEAYKIDMLELLSNGSVIVENNSSKDSSNFQGGIIYNHMSDELLHQLKERIEELKKSNDEKDSRIKFLEIRLFGE